MKTCPCCGNEIPENSKRCPKCHIKIDNDFSDETLNLVDGSETQYKSLNDRELEELKVKLMIELLKSQEHIKINTNTIRNVVMISFVISIIAGIIIFILAVIGK